ncbi:MAG: hypothetical protein ABIQ79_00650 [Nitrospiraceae bacterium]
MASSRGAAQAAVDAVSHIIVTQQVTNAPNDQQYAPGRADQGQRRRQAREVSADAG